MAFLLSLIASVSVSTKHLIYHRNEKLKTLDHFIVHIFGKFLKKIQDFKLVIKNVLLLIGNRWCFFNQIQKLLLSDTSIGAERHHNEKGRELGFKKFFLF